MTVEIDDIQTRESAVKTHESDTFASWFLRRYALVLRAALAAAAAGFVLMAAGKLLHHTSPFLEDILVEGGKVVVVTSVIGLLFEFLMHERFVERVKQQVAPVGDQVSRLNGSIDQLQRTVAITSGALQSGLSAVYSYRDEALEKIDRSLALAHRGDDFKIIGISLGDFLCPHGRLYARVTEALNAGVNIRALLLDVSSDAAMTRAQREEGDRNLPAINSDEWDDWYHRTQCYNELKTAIDVARKYVERFAGVPLGTGWSGKFDCRLYTLPPLCFLAITHDRMYVESYHYAGRGGEAPILKIAKSGAVPGGSSRLFEIYSKHFENVWAAAHPLTAPRRSLEVLTESAGAA